MAPTVKHIYDLIAQGENLRLDFKFEISDARKIAKTLSAFANTCGGRLLVGVKDNGRIAGVKSDEEAYMIDAAANIHSSPEIDYRIIPHLIEGKTILEVVIEEGRDKPYYAKVAELCDDGIRSERSIAYVRVADENIVASPVHLQLWRRRSGDDSLLIRYRQYEEMLMKHIAQRGSTTLSRLCRENRLNRHEAIKILAEFAYLGLISIEYRDGGFVFKIFPFGDGGWRV